MSGRGHDESPGVLLDEGPPTELFESRPTQSYDGPTKVSGQQLGEVTPDEEPSQVGLGHALYQTGLLEEQGEELRRLATSYEGLLRIVEADRADASWRRAAAGWSALALGIVAVVAVLLASAFCAGLRGTG